MRQLLPDFSSDFRHVFTAPHFVIFLQTYLHEPGMGSGVGSVNRGEIGRDPDVGDDHAQLVGRNDLAHDAFHLLDVLLAQFDTRSRRGLDVDDKLSGIGTWKECDAHERIQRETEN